MLSCVDYESELRSKRGPWRLLRCCIACWCVLRKFFIAHYISCEYVAYVYWREQIRNSGNFLLLRYELIYPWINSKQKCDSIKVSLSWTIKIMQAVRMATTVQEWGRGCGTSRKGTVAFHKPCYKSLRYRVMIIGFTVAPAKLICSLIWDPNIRSFGNIISLQQHMKSNIFDLHSGPCFPRRKCDNDIW